MIEIKLKKDYVAIVDDEDGDLALLNWNPKIHRRKVYAQRKLYIDGNPVTQLMHRVILARKLGRELLPCEKVDHIHGNGLDNRRLELRLASTAENGQNQGRNRANTSGCKGVTWDKASRKWVARIRANRKRYHLGSFDTREEACEAYRKAAKKHHKEFARFD